MAVWNSRGLEKLSKSNKRDLKYYEDLDMCPSLLTGEWEVGKHQEHLKEKFLFLPIISRSFDLIFLHGFYGIMQEEQTRDAKPLAALKK